VSVIRDLFFEYQGTGPWPCFFCGELVFGDTPLRTVNALNVHHKDENKRNHKRSNLKAAHQGCHSRHHMLGNKHGLGHSHTTETREQIGRKMKGMKRSPETRQKISEARLKYWREHGI
jgi:hypothetical protein